MLKEVTGKRSVRTDVINDTDGMALTESVDILKRWAEYCGKLYKNQDGDNDNTRLDQRCDYVREHPPLRSEVEWALGNIGNGKAPGMDDIPIELWKAAGDEGVDILWRICKLMDKRGMAKQLVQGSIHSNPEERKPEGVLKLSHNKPHSTCQQSFAEDHQRQH